MNPVRLLKRPAAVRRLSGARLREAASVLLGLVIPAGLLWSEPVRHDIAAGLLRVEQLDAGNTSASIVGTLLNTVNGLRFQPELSNRGDYNFQYGDGSAGNIEQVLLFACTAQNGRDNLEGTETNYVTTAIDYSRTGANAGGYWVALFNAPAGSEYNIDVGVAMFPYATWLAGFARNATTNATTGAVTIQNGGPNNLVTLSPALVNGTHFIDRGGGRSTVDLTSFGISSSRDGVLLVTGGKNEDNYAFSTVNEDGTWTILSKDNGTDAAALEQDPVSFVYVPRTNAAVVVGRFNGEGTVLLQSGGASPFALTKTDVGTYRLEIPGRTPADGVLLVSPEGGTNAALDNIVSYSTDAAGWEIQTRDLPSAVLEDVGTEPVASFVFVPSPTPGLTAGEAAGLLTREDETETSFTVVLDTQPTGNVTVAAVSDTPAEGEVLTLPVTFTPDNWNIPQAVEIRGVDDSRVDGPVRYGIRLSVTASEDPRYATLAPVVVPVTNTDNEPGVTISRAGGLTTSEAGQSDGFTVRLNTLPSAPVTIRFESLTPGEASVGPLELVFTGADWDQAKPVTVTGVNDRSDDGDRPFVIAVRASTSADPGYLGIGASQVTGVNVDDDTATISVAPTTGLNFSEHGGTATFTVTLGSQPLEEVLIRLASSDLTEAIVEPSELRFTATDWEGVRTVTVRGVDDAMMDGPVSLTLVTTLETGDAQYRLISPADVQAVSLDDEPAIRLPGGSRAYGFGSMAIRIDSLATVADDESSYAGGMLTVSLTPPDAGDVLEVRAGGEGDDAIVRDGPSVLRGGKVVATVSGGTSGTALTLALNGDAGPAAVQSILRALSYRHSGERSVSRVRSLGVSLADGRGGVSTVAKPLWVGWLRMTEFQEGIDHGSGTYSGQADAQLTEATPDVPSPAGGATGMLLDWPDSGRANTTQILMRFADLFGEGPGRIPTNAVIVSADLVLNITDTGDGGTFHRMLVPWDENEITWTSAGGGITPDDLRARTANESQLGLLDGSGSTTVGQVAISVRPDIEAWQRGEANHGWLMTGWPFNTDGTFITPSEWGTPLERPRLRVTWLPAGFQSVGFRNGVADYAGAQDTQLRQNVPQANHSATLALFSDARSAGNTDESQILIQFRDIIGTQAGQVPPGATIHAAILDVASVSADAMGDGGRLHALLKPWADLETNWESWADGVQADGVEAVAEASLTLGNPATLTPDVQAGFHGFNLTEDVQAWVSGVRDNNGWVVLPLDRGSNGWSFAASESEAEVNRPRLRVFYSPASNVAGAATLLVPEASGSGIRIPFTGTAGGAYTVQRARTLSGAWENVADVTAGTGGAAEWTDPAPVESGFYRVIAR